ncbi:dual OB domain-containing protein [Burkholderia stabilis]
MVTKRIICFANSHKRGAHCVAGREILPGNVLGGWIRPIGTGPEDALLYAEQAYADGSSPRILDLLDVHLTDHRPAGCQTENWFVDTSQRWVRIGRYQPNDMAPLVESPETLFENVGDTYAGLNDEIPNVIADARPGSLMLIQVPQLEIHVIPGFNVGTTKVQARFEYRGARYWLTVTDPAIKAEFQPRGVGAHNLGECLACISLAMPFNPNDGPVYYRYKLVAGIVRLT